MTNAGVMLFNAYLVVSMPVYTPMVFVNTSQAGVEGDIRNVQTTTNTMVDNREENGNPTMVTTDHNDSVESQIEQAFPKDDALTAKAIAYAESHHDPKKASNSDVMKDGRPFSVGLFQINLTWHKLAGTDCSKAFSGKNYSAVVIDEELYTKCVELAQDPKVNIETASGIYERSGKSFGQWTTYVNEDYKSFVAMFKS